MLKSPLNFHVSLYFKKFFNLYANFECKVIVSAQSLHCEDNAKEEAAYLSPSIHHPHVGWDSG